MRDIATEFFHGNPALAGPLLALVLFTVVFVVATVRALRAAPAKIDHIARLPLEVDAVTEQVKPHE
jgi:hypothetical protein